MKIPAPDDIKSYRREHSQTQRDAAELIYISQRTWQQYESGVRSMPAAFWELYKIKTGRSRQKPKTLPQRRPRIKSMMDILMQCASDENVQDCCYVWEGLLNPAGYPLASYGGKPTLVRRLAYEMHYHREIDSRTHVVDTCGNRKCCNPYHLELIDRQARARLPRKNLHKDVDD